MLLLVRCIIRSVYLFRYSIHVFADDHTAHLLIPSFSRDSLSVCRRAMKLTGRTQVELNHSTNDIYVSAYLADPKCTDPFQIQIEERRGVLESSSTDSLEAYSHRSRTNLVCSFSWWGLP